VFSPESIKTDIKMAETGKLKAVKRKRRAEKEGRGGPNKRLKEAAARRREVKTEEQETEDKEEEREEKRPKAAPVLIVERLARKGGDALTALRELADATMPGDSDVVHQFFAGRLPVPAQIFIRKL
jgi:hypothetical protein